MFRAGDGGRGVGGDRSRWRSGWRVYRRAAEPGQNLVLCATNIGTGAVDVTLEFINVKTGGVAMEKTVSLQPLGTGAASQPCVTMATEAVGGPHVDTPLAASFAAGGAADGEALVVGVAMVRKPLLSFRDAQVTASIQVMARDAERGDAHGADDSA